jgi:hypothetical protein
MNEESIQSQGGKARAEALTPEQRTAIAAKAALARWSDRPLRATHKGNFKEQFGIDVECYVLDDLQKTAVISQIGMGRTLGLSPRGNAFPRFLESKAMTKWVGAQLRQKIAQPVKFQWDSGGAHPPALVHGSDVTLLIDICRAIIEAEADGALDRQQERVAAQAHIILNASAKSGIKGLVYALAGYSPAAEEVIAAFKMYVQEEAKKYEKEFPPELYKAWYRLYQIPPIQGRGRPWQFKKLTVEHIYYPLAQSSGKILELARANKAAGGDRRKKLLQFLSDIGTRALRMHMGRVVEMADDSPDQATYEARIKKRFGSQLEFDLGPLSSK